MTWWELDWGFVLELDVPALELAIAWVDGRTVAWWVTDRGALLRVEHVGQS